MKKITYWRAFFYLSGHVIDFKKSFYELTSEQLVELNNVMNRTNYKPKNNSPKSKSAERQFFEFLRRKFKEHI